jgi:hypothetical protein
LSNYKSAYTLQELLVQLMTDRVLNARAAISSHLVLSQLPADKRDQLLTARGLLACGLLLHCLQSRHHVQHGINRCAHSPACACLCTHACMCQRQGVGHAQPVIRCVRLLLPPACLLLQLQLDKTCRSASAKKRMSVPFRAADLPSERSEFSQPDVALLYTHLAFYHDGLSLHEFKAAVQMLLSRGDNEQVYYYNRWLQQGRISGSQQPGAFSVLFACEVGCVLHIQLKPP